MKQSLKLNLSSTQTQQLSLTPQLKQSLKLLQLPTIDLEDEIQQALDNNPLLERVETPIVSPMQDHGVAQAVSDVAEPEQQLNHLEPEQDLVHSYQNALQTQHSPSNERSYHSAQLDGISQFASAPESLFEHLEWQIRMTNISTRDRLIAHALLHSINDQGYLVASLDEVASVFDRQLNVEVDEIQAMLSLIRSLEPLGVGARNIQDRLLMLLNAQPDEPNLAIAKTVVAEHLHLLSTRNVAKLKKQLKIGDQQLRDSLALITQLEPRVTSRFQADQHNHVIPDLLVTHIGKQWQAHINPDNEKKLRVNRTYSDLLKNDLATNDNEFIKDNLKQAKIFIKALMSRFDTLLLVGQAIVERQQDFFANGEQHMQPMVLKDIAQQLDLHESTISRATAGKYLACPQGVFELKFFFSSALSNDCNGYTSATAIRSLIKEMVAGELKSKPLSDGKIAQGLAQQGHVVARRTVAKYRESLRIAPSSQRKSLS